MRKRLRALEREIHSWFEEYALDHEFTQVVVTVGDM